MNCNLYFMNYCCFCCAIFSLYFLIFYWSYFNLYYNVYSLFFFDSMKIKSRLFLIVFSLFFANFADAFTVDKYNLEWDILSDWTINVHEDIAVDFSDWALHWIERILSRKYTVLDTIFQVFYDNINVINDNFTTYNDYLWDTIVIIWDKDILLDWKHSYYINYSTYWLIKSFSWMWYSELYWNVIWYEWDAPIHSPKIIINLPKAYSWFTDEDFIISLWFNQYHNIHEFPWEFSWDENKIYINYTWVLNRNQWITLSVKFPKDYFEFDHEKQASLFYDYPWYSYTEYSWRSHHLNAVAGRRQQQVESFRNRLPQRHRWAPGRRLGAASGDIRPGYNALYAGIRGRRDALCRSGGAGPGIFTGEALQHRHHRFRPRLRPDDGAGCRAGVAVFLMLPQRVSYAYGIWPDMRCS